MLDKASKEWDVSIIVPVYNSEKYVSRCVHSVLDFNKTRIQIILVEDGSSDNSVEECLKLKKEYDNVICIFHKKNMGQTITRNDGIKVATGNWMMFLDSDDILQPNAVDIMINAAKDTTTDIVFASYLLTRDNSSTNYKALLQNGIYSRDDFVNHIFIEVPSHVLTCIGSKLYRMNIIKKHDPFVLNSITTNYDMAFVIEALIESKTIMVINDAVYNYIQREDSITYSYRNDMFNRICEARKKIPELFKESGCGNKSYVEYARLQISLVSAALYQEIGFGKGFSNYKTTFEKIRFNDSFKELLRIIKENKMLCKDRLLVGMILHNRVYFSYMYFKLKRVYRYIRFHR